MAILTELKDPRVRNVTVTHVEVSPDMRQAKVHVSIMGDDTQQRLALHGLRSAAGFLQARLAEGIDTRYTPKLLFELDQGVKKSIEIARILQKVLPAETASATTEDASAGPTENIEALDSESAEHEAIDEGDEDG